MGMRSYRSYYTGHSGDKYTEDMAGFEIALAAVGGLALVPFTFGLSLLLIPFVALKTHLSLPPPPVGAATPTTPLPTPTSAARLWRLPELNAAG